MIWAVADGNASEYEALKHTEIEEFYRLMDIWYTNKKREMEALK